MDSHVRPPASRRNHATEIFEGLDPRASVDLREAYRFARGVVRLQPAAASPGPGHHLVWVRRAAFVATALRAAEDAFAVVGRHTHCAVILPDDPFVALRHVLVRSVALPAGGVALRVLDLHTGLGFVLPDGSRRASIFAEGPIAVGIGEYALVALPMESKDDELPGEMPAPIVESLASAAVPYRVNAKPRNRTSHITLMPSPLMVGEPLPQSIGRLTGGGKYALSLARGDRSATVMVTGEDLARGVVIGRSEKCHSEVLRRITDVGTSRAHLLVLGEGSIVHAYDLASTQGTYVGGVQARRVALSDQGTSITLGRGDGAVRFVWQAQERARG